MDPEGSLLPHFIAFEGLDGSGHTTQATCLAALLESRGIPVLLTREPSGGPVGMLIRQVLRREVDAGEEILPWLFAADRRHHLDREILPALAAGRWVLSDRYLASSLAYQSLSAPFARVADLNAEFLLPDLTIFLALEPRICMERIDRRGAPRECFEEVDRLALIASSYARGLDWCEARGADVVRISAEPPPDEVARAVIDALLERGWLS